MNPCAPATARRSFSILATTLAAALSASACGGVVDISAPKKDGGSILTPRPDSGVTDAFFERVVPPPDARADLAPYPDPGCPDVAPPSFDRECDPFAVRSDCPTGNGCYPLIRYPDGTCGQPQYGTACLPEGPGKQGDVCGSGGECAASFVCVESRLGPQCVHICDPDRFGSCDDGRVCDRLDVPGFGGCL